MQLFNNGHIRYSATDLITFLGCRHASYLDFNSLNEAVGAAEDAAINRLLQKNARAHQFACLQYVRDRRNRVVEIPENSSPEDRAALTYEAMESGADIICRAVLPDSQQAISATGGDAHFLLKCARPSGLGDISYEVLDARLARTAEPEHIIRICVYSDLLARLQDLRPATMHLFLDDCKRHSFRVDDFFHYYARAKNRFETFVRNLPTASRPEPCNHCGVCNWHDSCKARWEAEDHLGLVANIRHPQIDRFRKAGIKTVADLADTATNARIAEINRDEFLRLRSQAVLQRHKATTGEDRHEAIPCAPGKGLSRMPMPNDGDLFFAVEGDPLYPNGLEYLFGVCFREDGREACKQFWAHDHEEEKEAFARFMAFLADHLAAFPHAYIYHYSHYETTALKRLAGRYAACEELLDNLLRNEKFVSLYLVVREGIRTSEPNHAIQNLERFYMGKRDDAVATASDSIVAYNNWRATGADELLREIALHNRTDCVSTCLLRNWLLDQKPEDAPWFHEFPEHDEYEEQVDEEPPQRNDRIVRTEAYQNVLGTMDGGSSPIYERLSHLLEFHHREAKPQWWSRFERQNKFTDELINDAECLGGLQMIRSQGRSADYVYRFPPQEYKLKVGTSVVDVATLMPAGTLAAIDEDAGIAEIRQGWSSWALPKSLSLGPPPPINTGIIRDSLYRYADVLLRDTKGHHVATELLERNLPRFHDRRAGETIVVSEDLLAGALDAILSLNHSYLIIQGPPGAGKTHTSSQLIVELIGRGKKIGITANSHKAIHTLLEKVEKAAKDKCVKFRGLKKASNGNRETFYKGSFFRSVTQTRMMDPGADLFAGTAWTFSNEHFQGQLDYLFVDEAGQVSTANVVAMSNSTKNMILVGDQMQLGQPIQGFHPGKAGLSVLEFLLDDHATISGDRGIFLGKTFRMRPSICQFISDAFYDGRLSPHESTMHRRLNLQGADLPDEGIVMIPVEHEGCSQKSVEEGRVIKEKYRSLLGQPFADLDGTIRKITENDILVVTPYNVQVNYLRSLLSKGARVGTVDKFQGQEAPIVLVSMVTSSVENMPRHIEFLFSRNRLNVAISRAQCLAIVVANPNLFAIPCRTVEQMKLVNTFCWLDEYAERSA